MKSGSLAPEHVQPACPARQPAHVPEESIAWDDCGLAIYGRLALEWGRRYTAMEREWAEWAAGEIAAQ
jgi:hypothetical protein